VSETAFNVVDALVYAITDREPGGENDPTVDHHPLMLAELRRQGDELSRVKQKLDQASVLRIKQENAGVSILNGLWFPPGY